MITKFKLFENNNDFALTVIIGKYKRGENDLEKTLKLLDKNTESDYMKLIKCFRYYDLIKHLLENGANPNSFIKTPVLGWVTYNDDFERKFDIIKLLLKYGADVNGVNEEYPLRTPLYFEIINNETHINLIIDKKEKEEIIDFLLNNGATLNDEIFSAFEQYLPEYLINFKDDPQYIKYQINKNAKKFKI